MKPITLSMSAFGPYAEEQFIDFRQLGDCSFFLIHGPTGSGKTTILDAICFALYGETSGNERTGEQMRSHHTESGRPTEVILDFAVGSRLYRVSRSPRQERPKERGEGLIAVQAKATLWEFVDDENGSIEQELKASSWRDVTTEIEGLLGFQSGQFRQVIMLPQDKFQQLLKSGSGEREDILKILFQTDLYERIERALKDAADTLAAEIRTQEDRRRFILDQAEADSEAALGRIQQAQQDVLRSLTARIAKLRRVETEAVVKLRKGEEDSDKLSEREAAEASLVKLESGQADVARKRVTLDQGRRAAELAGSEESLRQRRKEATDAEDKSKAANATYAEADKKAHRARRALKQETEREGERQAVRQEVMQLQALRGKVEELQTARQAAISADVAVTSAQRLCSELGGQHDAMQERLTGQRTLLETLAGLAGRVEGHRLAVDNAKRLHDERQRLTSLEEQLRTIEAQRTRKEQQVREIEDELQQVRETASDVESAWLGGQAAILAGQLEEGQPCPVCGSVEHPHPAVCAVRPPSEEAVKQSRETLERTSQRCDTARQELTALEIQTVGRGEQIAALERSLGERRDVDVKILEQELHDARQLCVEAEEAEQRTPGLQDEIAELAQQASHLAGQLKEAEQNLRRCLDTQTVSRTQVDERRSGIPAHLQSPDGLARAAEKARTQVDVLERALRIAQDDAARTAEILAARREAFDQLSESAEIARSRASDEAASFEQSVRELGFAGVDEYLGAKRPKQVLEGLDAEIKSSEGRLEAARDRAARARMAASGLVGPDLETLRLAAEAAREQVEDAAREQTRAEGELEQIGSWLSSLNDINQELRSKEQEYRVVGRIAEVANGRNPHKITFQRFVLARLLEAVLSDASRRLQVMSKGRYLLQRTESPADRRRAGGLDLSVVDTWTGDTTRAATTLSGGESFYASLALALGLANTVQEYAGGIHLDTIFVDEGFGSLDADSLDLAIQTLEGLREGKRLVGIISHVDSLAERIPRRLEIRSGTSGSTAQFAGS